MCLTDICQNTLGFYNVHIYLPKYDPVAVLDRENVNLDIYNFKDFFFFKFGSKEFLNLMLGYAGS